MDVRVQAKIVVGAGERDALALEDLAHGDRLEVGVSGEEFGDDVIDLILDGGPCSVGIESTVLDLTAAPAAKP